MASCEPYGVEKISYKWNKTNLADDEFEIKQHTIGHRQATESTMPQQSFQENMDNAFERMYQNRPPKNPNLDRHEFLNNFKIQRINSSKYNYDTCKYLSGHDLTIAYFQRYGFKQPIFTPEKDGLGIKIASIKQFKLIDIRKCV
jgi:hypothetical protein